MRHLSLLALAGTLSLALAGCNTTEVTSTLSQIEQDCATLQAGSSLLIAVSTLGGPTVATITQGVAAGSAACVAVLPQVSAAIAAITNVGGTAAVSVTTTTPQGLKRTRKLTITPAIAQTFIVGPNTLF